MREQLTELWDAVSSVFRDLDWTSPLVGLIATVVATVLLVILFRICRGVLRRMEERVLLWKGTRIRAIRFQRQEILSAEEITQLVRGFLRGCFYLVVVLLLSMYVNAVFSFFPWTRGLTAALLGYLVDTLRLVFGTLVEYLPKLLLITVIMLLAGYLVKLARLIFNGIGRGRITLPGFYPEWASPTFNLVRLLVITFAVVVAFPYLPGAGSPGFRAVSIFVGVLLSLGSTAAVANVVAGTVITYMRAFRIGDRVKIADTVGEVMERTMFVTRVRTPKNVVVAVPNSMVLANHIVNFSSLAKRRGVILPTSITIGYDVPWRTVRELLLQAAAATEHVDAEPEPFVHQTSLDDFYVSYELNVSTRQPKNMQAIYSELHGHILDRFHEAGVEIMSPHYAALRDGNPAAVPDENLPRDYQPPAFRVHPFENLLRGAKTPSRE